MRESLINIPESLEDLYERIITRLPKKNRVRVRSILQWITFSMRPMSLEELADAVGLPFADDVLAICTTGLVRISREQIHFKLDARNAYGVLVSDILIRVCDVVGLAHFSVREYLCSDRCKELDPSIDFSFSMDLRMSHAEIAEFCMSRLLSAEEKTNINQEPESVGTNREDSQRTSHPWNSLDRPLIQYIAMYWSEYVAESNPNNTVDCKLSSMVKDFFSAPLSAYNHWLRHYDPEKAQFRLLQSEEQCLPPTYVASLLGLVAYVPGISQSEINKSHPGAKHHYALLAAIDKGHCDTVSVLLERGACVNICSDQGTALMAASRHGYTAIAEQLLKAGSRVNTFLDSWGTALNVACHTGVKNVVSLLIKAGAEIHLPGEQGSKCAPLQTACLEGSEIVIELMLQLGAEVNRAEGICHTALQAACSVGQHGIVDRLLKEGADVNAQGGYYGSAVKASLYQERTEVVLKILAAGADVNSVHTDYTGYFDWFRGTIEDVTALHIAVVRCSAATVKMLLAAGADVNIMTKRKMWRSRQATFSKANNLHNEFSPDIEVSKPN